MEGVLGKLGGFDPMTQGLLSAAFRGLQMSGPSVGKPVSFGQVLGGAGEAGMNTYSQANKTQMDEAYRRRLMELEQVKTDMAKQQLQQQTRQAQIENDILSRYGLLSGSSAPSGGAPAPGLSPTSAAGLNAPWAAAAPSSHTQQSGGLTSLPPDALVLLNKRFPGLIDMAKHLDTPQKLEGGSTYVDRRTGLERFMPKVDTGMVPGPNGGIGVAPGALETIRAIEGVKEDVKADRDPYIVQPTTPGGTPTISTRGAVTGAARATTAPAPAPTPAPTPGPVPKPGSFPALLAEDKANAPKAARTAVAMMEREIAGFETELARTTDPARKLELQDAIKGTRSEIASTRKRFMLGNGPVDAPAVTGVPSGLSENQKATVKASETASGEFIKEMRDNYSKLRDVPVTLATLDKAASLVPKASGFMGPFGQQKLEVSKFLRANVPGFESFKGEGVASAEELRSAIFTQIMDNLKKMDSQPSQQQQQVMQDALGKLGTDPEALPRVLNVMRDVMQQKATIHNRTVADAIKGGTVFPYNVAIDLNEGRTTELPKPAPSQSGGDIASKVLAAGQLYEPDKYEYRLGMNGQIQRRKK